MMQSRTHNCGQLRLADAGQNVTLCGWMENVREVGANFAFVVLRDYYGTTQVVVETAEMMQIIKGLNKETTIQVEGVVRERESKNPKQPTGEIEVVPTGIKVLASAATISCLSRSTSPRKQTKMSDLSTVTWIFGILK